MSFSTNAKLFFILKAFFKTTIMKNMLTQGETNFHASSFREI